MELRQLIEDEDAVSPVIGVILMVAITVILAAVIGTFVLGLGDQVQNTAPSASFTFDFDQSVNPGEATDTTNELADNSANADDGELSITHDGGPEIGQARLSVGDDDGESITAATAGWPDPVSAGDTANVMIDNDDTIRVIWSSEGGQKTATLGKFTAPDA